MKKVLFSTDLEKDQAAALQVAVQHARNLGAQLLVVHVELPSSAGFVPLLDEARAGGPKSERLKAFEAATPVGPGRLTRHVLLQGDPAQQIVALARSEAVDLIVLRTRGRRGLQRLLRGSVAEEVVRFAPCPVYAFRAEEIEEPAPVPAGPRRDEAELLVQNAPNRLAEDLMVLLSGEVAGLRMWFARQLGAARALAIDNVVEPTALELIALGAEHERRQPLLARLRHYMDAVSRAYGSSDFFVLDRSGRVVASPLDAAIGHVLAPEDHDFVASALAGDARVSHPVDSDLPRPGPISLRQAARPSVFVVAPLKDGAAIRGLIGYRLRAEELNRLLVTSSPYRSIESYVFDRAGAMLSPSRFEAQLLDAGVFPESSGGHRYLRDPGGELLRGHRPSVPWEALPLTRMAADAVQGRSGIDLEGYRDYRGVVVVGAWQWLAEQAMGVAIEVDRAEVS